MVVEYAEWSLDEAIWNAIDIWGDTRQEFWDDIEDQKASSGRRAGEMLAKLALDATAEMALAELPAAFARLDREVADSEVVLEPIELAVAKRLSTDVRAKARRCLELAELVVEARPAEQVLRYLRRLSRCYVAGFEPEAIVMCRAVLENAVRDAFARRKLPIPKDEHGQSTMATRIRAAVRFDLLPAEFQKDAITIWKRGSKAAHEDPQVTRDILGTIRMTMLVVSALYSR